MGWVRLEGETQND